MKIIEIQSGLLTNEEVLTHILDVRANNADNKEFKKIKTSVRDSDGTTVKRLDGKLKELNYMTDDIIKHFAHADSPLSHIATAKKPHTSSSRQSQPKPQSTTPEARTTELIQRLKPFHLTKSEVLNIANHRPRNETVLDVLVEEMEERFSTEQQGEVLGIVREVYDLPDVMVEG